MSLKCSVLKSGFCEITQGFGGSNNHRGLDLVGKDYTVDDIVSYSAGNVLMSVTGYGNGQGEGVNWRYGNFVKIQHDDGTVCLYAHLERASVSAGQRVSKGQVLGRMGNSGNSFGAHLHWEFWTKNDYYSNIDPSPYLQPKEPITLANPVQRDVNKEQLEILINDNMRVRSTCSTVENNILGILQKGFYDVLSKQDKNGYTWVETKKGQYTALILGYAELRPKKEEIKENVENSVENSVENVENTEENDTPKNNDLEGNIDTKEEDNTNTLEDTKTLEIEHLKQEIEQYKNVLEKYSVFVAPNDDLYHINLKKNETILYEIKKD